LPDQLAPTTDAPEPDAADAAIGLTVESVSPKKQAYLRFKQHKAAVVSVFVLAFLTLWVLLAPITARYGVAEQVIDIREGANQNLAPFRDAWFGTDVNGFDIYSRLLYGTRVSLFLGLAAAAVSMFIGTAVGAIAGLKGGWFDDVMMRVTDIFLAFPTLVALLIMRNLLAAIPFLEPVIGNPSSIRFLIFLFAIFGWMTVARVVRAQILALKEREFVEAARAIGAKPFYLIRRHLIPNSIGPLLVAASLAVVGAIVGESTLALFGYGPQPGQGATSLGNLVSDSPRAALAGYWWQVVYPFAFLLVITVCFSFIGDGLRDATDPKSSQGRAA
jgi:ABC-type dipeptide/oligopeptide/nickel transport system permease subunit